MDHRNGTYLRRLLTGHGPDRGRYPRTREKGAPANVIGRYWGRSEELDAMIVEAYMGGISQRRMGSVAAALMGERVGRSPVSRVVKQLDEAVHRLKNEPIVGPRRTSIWAPRSWTRAGPGR